MLGKGFPFLCVGWTCGHRPWSWFSEGVHKRRIFWEGCNASLEGSKPDYVLRWRACTCIAGTYQCNVGLQFLGAKCPSPWRLEAVGFQRGRSCCSREISTDSMQSSGWRWTQPVVLGECGRTCSGISGCHWLKSVAFVHACALRFFLFWT